MREREGGRERGREGGRGEKGMLHTQCVVRGSVQCGKAVLSQVPSLQTDDNDRLTQ